MAGGDETNPHARNDDSVGEKNGRETYRFGSERSENYFNARRFLQRRCKYRQLKVNATTTEPEQEPKKKRKKRIALMKDEKEQLIDEESDFDMPSHEEVRQIVAQSDLKNEELKAERPGSEQEHLFENWRGTLLAGFNILCHGFGSKMQILKNFGSSNFQDSHVIELYGFLPSVSIRQLCMSILEQVLCVKQNTGKKHLHTLVVPLMSFYPPTATFHKCKAIVDFQSNPRCPRILLIIHSIEGPSLRSEEIQRCLSTLATAKFIHVIASMDHINSRFIWSDRDVIRYQWVHYCLDSSDLYEQEAGQKLQKSESSSRQSPEGLQYIVQSLAPKDVQILQLIAKIQLKDSIVNTRRPFAEYTQVYDAALHDMIIRSHGQLNRSIKTLLEHSVLRRRLFRGQEHVEIPFEVRIIKNVILKDGTIV